MISKKARLSRALFDTVYREGRRFPSPLFQVVALKAPHFKAAVVVGKKVARLAVSRNRKRRQIYALLRNEQFIHSFRGEFLFLSKPALAKATLAEVRASLEQVFGLLREAGYNTPTK